MPDLIAQGPSGHHRWRRALPDSTSNRKLVLGRVESDWNVPWDTLISRKHITLEVFSENQLRIVKNATARNAVFFRGHETSQFTMAIGEHFVVGETTFTFVNRPGTTDNPTKHSVTEHAFDQVHLRRRNFHDAQSRIEVLSRLPDLMTSSESDEELLVRVSSVLLQATPSASAVAIVVMDDDCEDESVHLLHYDSRRFDDDCAAVSSRLVRHAIQRRESILQIWSDSSIGNIDFTTNEGVDWAFCVPLRSEACLGWCIYVAGQTQSLASLTNDIADDSIPEQLEDDVKFAELVGTMFSNLRQSHRLQRRQASMRHFFAPLVLDALASGDASEVLSPREADLTVMFCDLRGFSQQSEQHSDQLFELLERVSEALGVMTRAILELGGVIGDFHGDAAMGFWGWPLDQEDGSSRATLAAMKICNAELNASANENGFQHGIGIASGRGVAGRIGTSDQVKVTAFGPVVNLASRLEGLTKVFGGESHS